MKERRKNRPEELTVRRSLRTNGTKEEAMMWKVLKNRQVSGVRFRRQFSVGAYILDFYCPELKLCIELDGAGHYNSEGLQHDYVRDKYLSELGIRVLRFENLAVLKMQPVMLAEIEAVIAELREKGK